MSLTLSIVMPEREVVHDTVDEVQLPGSEGYFGVLPGHTPLLATLKIGELWYRKGPEKLYVMIANGFAEVLPDRVTVLAERAERAEDIDVTRAEAAKARADERARTPEAGLDYERVRAAIDKANTRLQVARHARARG
ncbi:MAG: F0F1 ATP synthase subunit epsilon [Luteitalea sp.]|nr:F0F1 ATP synthase subunit epsilon [Luteitalea sp.]